MSTVAASPPPEHGVATLAGGAQLHLRRASSADATALFDAYAADPLATRFLSWPPRRSADEVARWLAPSLAGWDERRCFRWVLSDRPGGPAFGTVVLRAGDPRTWPVGWTVGYAVGRGQQGRGIATAAVRQMQRWAPHSLGPGTPLLARTDPSHSASVRVLRRCGFRLIGRELASWTRPTLGPEPRDALCFRWSSYGRW